MAVGRVLCHARLGPGQPCLEKQEVFQLTDSHVKVPSNPAVKEMRSRVQQPCRAGAHSQAHAWPPKNTPEPLNWGCPAGLRGWQG